MGFGKAKEGKDYLAIYMCGETNGKYGVFCSDDMAESFIRINDDDHKYGSINYAITGDMRVYGRVFFGTNGREIIYGDIKNDKIVDLSDLVALSMYLRGDIDFDQRQLNAADIMGSGEVGIDGLARLRQYIMNDPITLGPIKLI